MIGLALRALVALSLALGPVAAEAQRLRPGQAPGVAAARAIGLRYLAPAGGVPVDLIVNGDYSADDAGWTGFDFLTKSPDYANKRATFNNAAPYDGLGQPAQFSIGAFYEVKFTIVTRTAGSLVPRFIGGTTRNGAERVNVGTYTQRLFTNTGNNYFDLTPWDNGFTGSVDNVSVTGPYTTATIGGL